MTWTATWKRLHRFFAVLIVLALPLQGQAVASMSCHTMPTGLAASKATSTVRMGHSHQQAPVHQHDHAVMHHHANHQESSQSIHGDHQANLALDSAVFVTATDLPGTPIDPMNADTCALCAAGCSMAAPLPAFHKSLPPSTTDHQQPAWHISSAYVGVVLDGLLRPPR